MPFAPEEFYNLAKWLCGEAGVPAGEQGVRHDEAAIRTSISRTYYAAHLMTREALVRKGWSPPKGGAHEAVLRELRGRHKMRLAGDLNKLRRLREHADYHIDANCGHSPDSCGYCDRHKTPDSAGPVVDDNHWQEAISIAPMLIALLQKF